MDPTKRILALLYDRGEGFYALNELASVCDLPARQVSALLDELQRRGVPLELSPSHGVRLAGPLRLDADLIERDLGTQRVGRSVLVFDEVDSTSDVAFDAARSGDPDGLVVLAESQRKGRGRFGRSWSSPPHQNILMSAVLSDPSELLGPEALTIAAGLAVAESVEGVCGVSADIKWPNDVRIDGAKVAGVLQEVRLVRGVRTVVLGVGVNANACPPRSKIDAPGTSLAAHLGRPVERIEVVRALLRRIDLWVDKVASESYHELHDAWVAHCGMIHQRITVACDNRRHTGVVEDVSPLEGLLLRDDAGHLLHLPAGRSTIVK